MINRLNKFATYIIVTVAFSLASTAVKALPTYDPEDPIGEELSCVPKIIANGQPQMIGYPLVGQSVTIYARNLKLFNIGESCSGQQRALNPGEFQWEFILPTGSAGDVQDINTLTPKILIDTAGGYIAKFIACPNGCTFESSSPSGIPVIVEVEPQPAKIVSFETTPALPPETRPFLPASALSFTDRTPSPKSERDIKCGYGGGCGWSTMGHSRSVQWTS